MTPDTPPRLREPEAHELLAVAHLVAAQPLLVRYQTTAESLGAALAAAHRRGEGLLLVEDAAGEVAGFAWFQPSGTLGLGAYLRLIALAPGREGQGLGALLLDEVERRAALGSRHLFLLCTASNAPARRFYERRGYRESGLLPDLVRPGLDEVLYWKRLPPP